MKKPTTLLALAMAVALTFPGSTEAGALSEVKKLLASDAQAGDLFGGSVAVSGDTAIVGGTSDGGNAGAGYIFGRDEGGPDNWGEVKKLTAPTQEFEEFGFSVALSGDTAVVGARLDDGGGVLFDNFGAAYVFQRDEGGADNWGEVKQLLASDAQQFDQFGFSVALTGDTVVVGARLEDAGGSNAGAAYVFGRDQGGADNWGEVKKVIASDAVSSQFGFSVAVSGDTAIVGALSGEGAAYVYGRDEGGADNWGEVKKLTASDAEALDHFGSSAALNGDTAIIGANQEDTGGNNAGAAYVFGRDQGGAGNWGEVTKLTASDPEALDRFGGSVAVSGDTTVVGALAEDAGGNRAGAAYVFGREEGGADNWGEVTKLTASDAQANDVFGISVAVSGDTAFVGASAEDAGGSDAGAAYVFGQPVPTPTPTPAATAVTAPTGTPQLGPTATVAAVSLPETGAPNDGSGGASVLPWLSAGVVAGAFALGGGTWYARRRWLP